MPDPTASRDEPTAARKKTDPPAPAPEPAPAAVEPAPASEDTASRYEPYPGAHFFHGGRHSPIFVGMARRLEQEGCTDGRHLGPDWTTAHRDAFAGWQRTLRPKEAGDTSGTPDEIAWDRLEVPRVTPLPKESTP